MTFSLRSFARSRGLRALGLLAWLVLAITSLAMPLGMANTHAHAIHVAAAALGEPMHHGSQPVPSHHDCCEASPTAAHPVGHVCGCLSMCVSVLPPNPAGSPPGVLMAMPHPWPLGVHAPTAPAIPPLRPPLANLSCA